MSLGWLSQGMGDAPADDAWLSPREAAWASRMRFPKRRTEFRLGRWTAKTALAVYLGRGRSPEDLRAIEIDRAPDGAPRALVDGHPAPAYLTMTDRADQAVCLVGPPGTALGCDLEIVEPRSDAFVADFLTAAEQGLVAAAGKDRDLLANLVWCGKESALKVLRTGLRRDTRSVEVSFPGGGAPRRLGADERPRRRGRGLPGVVAALLCLRADGGRGLALRPSATARRAARPRDGHSLGVLAHAAAALIRGL